MNDDNRNFKKHWLKEHIGDIVLFGMLLMWVLVLLCPEYMQRYNSWTAPTATGA